MSGQRRKFKGLARAGRAGRRIRGWRRGALELDLAGAKTPRGRDPRVAPTSAPRPAVGWVAYQVGTRRISHR